MGKYSNCQYDYLRAHDHMGQASGTLPSSSKRCTDQSHNHQYTSVGTSERTADRTADGTTDWW